LCGVSRRSATPAVRLAVLLVLNAGGLASQVPEVEEPAAAHDATGDHLDLLETRRMQHEHALDAHVEADLAHREGGAHALPVAFDHDAAEDLDTLLVALHDFVV